MDCPKAIHIVVSHHYATLSVGYVIDVYNNSSLMSIYSGFPTRRDEERYNTLLSKLILTLQGHLLELIGEGAPPHAKNVTYSRIIAKMRDF